MIIAFFETLSRPKAMAIVLALISLGAGLYAAWKWKQSSDVAIDPAWSSPTAEPGNPEMAQNGWISGMLAANTQAAELNKTAARWTAVSVSMGALANVVSVLAG